MAVNYTDFEKIWASTSPLTPYSFSDANYKRGWDFVGSTPPSRQMWDAFMQNADEKLQYLYLHEDVPVGHEYFTFNPNVPQGSLPLFGGEYSRETYSALWAWVQQQTGYLKTDAEWQALAASNNGNVPYYSDGDGSTTFRVPALKCYIKAADGTVTEVGSYYAAGLPNITATARPIAETSPAGGYSLDIKDASGAIRTIGSFTQSQGSTMASMTSKTINFGIDFDASRSSSIYGNSTTVTPETVVGLWLVKAYGVIQDTGTINEQQYIDDRFAAAKDYTDSEIAAGVPTGCVQAFAGNNTPAGWLLCDGAAVSRITYAALFSVIGTSYGDGDGSTTFNVPNLIDKFVEGSATVGTEKTAGLPNITGSGVIVQAVDNTVGQGLWTRGGNGAIYAGGSWARTGTLNNYTAHENYPSEICIDASRSNSIYGNSTTVQPPAVTMRYIIKY